MRDERRALTDRVKAEESALENVHAATKKAEIEQARQHRAAESVLLNLRREEKYSRDRLESLRDEAQEFKRELAALVREKETQVALYQEQEKKNELRHKTLKAEEEELHHRLQEGKEKFGIRSCCLPGCERIIANPC